MRMIIALKNLKREIKMLLFNTFSKKKTLELLETNLGYPYNTDKIETIDNFKISDKTKSEYMTCFNLFSQTLIAVPCAFIVFLVALICSFASIFFIGVKLILIPFYLIYFYFKVENLRNDPKFKELKKRHFDCIERFGKNEVCKCK